MSTVAHPTPESKTAFAGRAVAALRTETGLARVALGVAALHVVDDNFLQPEPGVSARDHLWGGLVQVALLVAFAWGYPRLRAGLRGILAVYVGLFIIVMGAGEAGYYTREDGPSGDDFTGLLMIPAGVLLAGIGVVTLWRSRKGGSVVRRYGRRVALGLVFVVTLPFVMYPLAESYIVTHSGRTFVPTPQLGAPYEEVSFTTSDGLRLHGWFVPPKNGATVISFPGRKGPQSRLGCSPTMATACCCSIDAARARATATRTSSAGRTRDLEAAVAYLKARPEVDQQRIGGIGLSVGGEMMLQEAAETDGIKAVVSEGAGVRSVREALHVDGAEKMAYAWLFGLTTLGTTVFTSNLPPRSLTDLSAQITEPVLFIHATPGQGGETLTEKYYEAAKGPRSTGRRPAGTPAPLMPRRKSTSAA